MGRAASTVFAVLAICACATRPSPSSNAPPGRNGSPTEKGSGGGSHEPARWTRMAEVRTWEPVNAKPFVSLGHPPGNQLANIHVSPEARETYEKLLPGATLPVGSVVAEIQRDPATGQPGLSYVMTKLDGQSWEFMLVRSDGRILERGDVPPCARCHAEAIADSLFGVPVGE